MVTFAQMLADRSRQWLVFVRFQGVGPWLSAGDLTSSGNDARYRFSVATPSHAASHPATLWRPYLAEPLPDILSEETPTWGGVAGYGGTTVNLLDYNDFLTTLFSTDEPPVTVIDQGVAITDGTISVASNTSGSITATSVIYLNDEAMRVTVAPTTAPAVLTVTRAYLGTIARRHSVGSGVFTSTPYLVDREFEIVVCPANSSSSADEQIVGRYRVDGLEWTSETNIWSISGSSTLADLERVTPYEIQELTIQAIDSTHPAWRIYFDADHDSSGYWDHWLGGVNADSTHYPPIDAFAMTEDGEIIGLDNSNTGSGYYAISKRGLLGTPVGEINVGQKLRHVMVTGDPLDNLPGSFRSLAAGDDDHTADTATRGCHAADIILNILTSDQNFDHGIGTNDDGTNRNYSILPSGFGIGLPVSRIDVASFEDVRRRTPQFVHSMFVLGDEQKSAADIITELCEPMGAIVSIDDGTIYMTLPSINVAGETVTSIDNDDILVSQKEDLTYGPNLRAMISTARLAGAIRYKVGSGNDKREVTVNDTSFETTYGRRGTFGAIKAQEFEIDTMDRDMVDLVASRGFAFLSRSNRPRIEVSIDVDPNASWDAPPGDKLTVTVDELPDMSGNRGWTAMPATMKRREHRFGQSGVVSSVDVTAFGTRFAGRKVAPAAYVTSVASNTATCSANRYTSSDSPAIYGLPATDVQAFTVNDVVRLITVTGASAGGTTQIVQSIGANTLTLDGNFGGNLAANRIIVAADYDDCVSAQRTRFAFEADTTLQTIDSSTAEPVIYADE